MTKNRRPIKSRSNGFIVALSSYISTTRVTPNQISCASAVFSVIGSVAILALDNPLAMVLAMVCIQLRLLCNVIDGLVAVEGGKRSIVGPIFNEFPDRIADSVLLIAAGYACGIPSLGWAAALFAALTAYVRVFGGSLGQPQRFIGPMAKQHRMALLTLACVITIAEHFLHFRHISMPMLLGIITAGSVITCVTRTAAVVRDIHQSADKGNHE